MSKKIIITINKKGGINYKMEGFIGEQCYEEAKKLRELGKIDSEEETEENLLTEEETENNYQS